MKKIDKGSIEDILALTPMQEGMLFHYLKDPNSDYHFEQLSLEISGEIDVEIFEKAWDFVVETNEILRAVFRWEEIENPIQIILQAHRIQPRYYDFSGKKRIQNRKSVEEIKIEDRKETFDLREVPFRVTLCKVGEDKYEMIISNHHILYDGWSNGIILKEFFKAYDDLSNGKDLEKPVKTKFKRFIKWNQKQDKNKQKQFWEGYLKGVDTQGKLQLVQRRGEKEKAAENHQIILPQDIKEILEDFVKNNRFTLASFFYSAWGILLQKYCNSTDVLFGTTVSGRSAPISGIEDMVGLFINTIPLRVKTGVGEKVKDLLCKINDILPIRETYESTPLVDIRGCSKLKSNGALFDSIVVLENYPLSRWLMEESSPLSLAVHSYSMVETSIYNLSIGIFIGDTIEIGINYNRALFEKSVIGRLAHHFINIIKNILIDYETDIAGLGMLAEEEKKRILYDFNRTAEEYPKDKPLHKLFEEQVEKTPDNIALIFQDKELTYWELNKKANQLAALLIEKGSTPGTLAVLLMDRSLELIIGMLAVLKSGGIYLPVDPGYPVRRIHYMLKDSHSQLVLTQRHILNKVKFEGTVIEIDDRDIYTSGRITANLEITDDPKTPAYVIYTSGSSGRPKGVVVEHFSVVNLAVYQKKRFEINESDRVLQFSTICFDASVEQIFIAFFSGAVLVLIDKGTLLDANKFSAFLSGRAVTHLHAVPTFLNNMRLSDTSHLRRVISGGDVCPAALVEKWSQSCDFYNEYGPTETTVTSIEMRVTFEEVRESMARLPIGRPIGNTVVYVFDRWMHPVPLEIAGELYIGGEGAARGYLNNPELTKEKFINISEQASLFPTPHSPTHPLTHSTIYRTGDMARWLANGNIDFLGRLDNQVKVRGFRIEPGEIENRLLNHPSVKEAVVSVFAGHRGERNLCAYIVGTVAAAGGALNMPNRTQLKAYLAQTLPDYMIPNYFVWLESLPLMPTGKIDKKALPGPETKSEREYLAPRNEGEQLLVNIWSDVLGLEKEKIGIDDDFFELGGHSLKAIYLISRIHKSFNIEVPLLELFKSPTVGGIYHYMSMRRIGQRVHRSIELAEEREYYPLTTTQKRFYIIQQLDADDVSYNMPETMLMEGQLSRERFEEVFKQLLPRHESLRTSFHLLGGEPVQRIHKLEEVEFEFEYYDLIKDDSPISVIEVEKTVAHFVRPFDLSRAPLWRVGFIRTAPETHYFMFDMHHIIIDGTSLGLFIRDFLFIYKEEVLPPLNVRYRDYSLWQKKRKESAAGLSQRISHPGEGEEEVLNLPTDYMRPVVSTYEGHTIIFNVGTDVTGALHNLSLERDVTLYMILLSACYILFSKLSGQENIAIGSPIAGRVHVDLDHVIGLFLNILCLRNQPTGEKRFSEFLTEVKEHTLNAFESQDYQYDELMEKTVLARETGRNLLFDVMFVLQNMDMPEVEIPGLRVTRNVSENRTSKFDITLYCEEKDTLIFEMEYSVRLFKEETIQRFAQYFKKVISNVLENPHKKIADIEIIPDEEKQQILYDFNDTYLEYPWDKSIRQLFEEQAEKTPDNIAVVGMDGRMREMALTYKELNKRANQLAHLIRKKGVTPDTIVGIMVERGIEMIVGILGILKSGGAYLPIDPQYPGRRISYMLADSNVKVLLSELSEVCGGTEVIDLPSLIVENEDAEPTHLTHLTHPTQLAYIIYTSGTTGKPKGVLIEHFSVINLAFSQKNYFNINERDRILQFSSICFDASVEQIFIALYSGAVLVLIDKETLLDNRRFAAFISSRVVTHIHAVPSFLTNMNIKYPQRLKRVIAGGDVCPKSLAKQWGGCCEFFNEYGPTETTVTSIEMKFEEEDGTWPSLPIGKPIPNTLVYLFDRWMKLVPLGVAGELYIGGEGVARGYVNRPELTLEKFTENPYKKGRYLYCTGDLCRWLADGNIEFFGRIDYQVKVRGFRVELGEVESRLSSHKHVKETVVMVREGDRGDKYLCAYIVSPHTASFQETEIREYLERELPHYMVPAYFVALEKIPLNPNGKVDRKALPEPDITSGIGNDFEPPANERERLLVDIWAEVLSLDRRCISVHDNFFHLGGHSLKAAGLIARVYRALSKEIPISELFRNPTIRGICQYIDKTGTRIYLPVEPVEEKEYYSLSSAQKRLYLLYQAGRSAVAYNIPTFMMLEGKLEEETLEEVFEGLIVRHESFRTYFEQIKGEPMQRIHEGVEFEIECYSLERRVESGEDGEKPYSGFIENFVRPFDLSCPPLLRVGLIEFDKEKYILMVDMHHIIADGISTGILVREFMALYGGEVLPPAAVRYRDYSEWQKREKDSEKMRQQEVFWLKEFEGEIPLLRLPMDYPDPLELSFDGASIEFVLGKEETAALSRLAKEEEVTLYMVLLALYNVLLARLSGQEDIIVGTPVMGRSRKELQCTVGMFVNTLPIRNYPKADYTLRDFLKEVAERTVNAFENQDYPLEELVARVSPGWGKTDNPLFNVMFVLQNMDIPGLRIPGLVLTPYHYKQRSAKFHLNLTGVEKSQTLRFTLEYSSKRFKVDTIERFAGYFKDIVHAVEENKEIKLSDIKIGMELSKAESAIAVEAKGEFKF